MPTLRVRLNHGSPYGSTPPPTSDNWTLTLHGDGTADYTHEASHVDEVVYEDNGFDVDPAAAQRICEAAASVPEASDPLAGGPYVHWELSGESGSATHLRRLTSARFRAWSRDSGTRWG